MAEDSANHQDFTNVVAAQKELAGGEVFKEIFNMTVIEDPLQLKALDGFEFQRILLNDMVPRIQGFGPSVLGVKEGQKVALGLQHGL